MTTPGMSFAERRAEISAIADDAANIAHDLERFAKILGEHARFLNGEVEAMKRAEERFAKRADTKKAAPESRP